MFLLFSFMFDSLCICVFERLEAFSRPRVLECKVMTLANVSKLMSAATVSTMCLVSLALLFLSLSEHDSITVTQVSSTVCHCMGCRLPDIVFEAATCCNNEFVQGLMRWPTNLWSACVGTGLARVACLAMVVKLTRNKNLHVEEGSKPLRCTENQTHFSPLRNWVNLQVQGLSEAKVVPTIESTLLLPWRLSGEKGIPILGSLRSYFCKQGTSFNPNGQGGLFQHFSFLFYPATRTIWLVILKAGAALLLTATSLDEWLAKFCDTIPEICGDWSW